MRFVNSDEFAVKEKILDFFAHRKRLLGTNFYCRLFDPTNDIIIPNFSEEEWEQIYPGVTTEALIDLSEHINKTIIVACDNSTAKLIGFMCIEEILDHKMHIKFHGGFWTHDFRHILMQYQGTCLTLEFLFYLGASVEVTCNIGNVRADRFQRSLGFVEYENDGVLSYKKLEKDDFQKTAIYEKFNIKELFYHNAVFSQE